MGVWEGLGIEYLGGTARWEEREKQCNSILMKYIKQIKTKRKKENSKKNNNNKIATKKASKQIEAGSLDLGKDSRLDTKNTWKKTL